MFKNEIKRKEDEDSRDEVVTVNITSFIIVHFIAFMMVL